MTSYRLRPVRSNHTAFVPSLNRINNLNQESDIAAMDICFGVQIESDIIGNVTLFYQYMRSYCDDQLSPETCTIEYAAFVPSLNRINDLNQESDIAAIDIGFGVQIESDIIGNVIRFYQYMQAYCDDQLSPETCTIESRCLGIFTRSYR